MSAGFTPLDDDRPRREKFWENFEVAVMVVIFVGPWAAALVIGFIFFMKFMAGLG